MADVKDPVTDLCERLHTLRLRYQVTFNELSPANPPYIPMAEAIVKSLTDMDPAVHTVILAVVDPCELELPSFWATPLGRLLFMAGGYPHGYMTQADAAAVVGVSRQRISNLLKLGKLSYAWDSKVHVEEIRDLMKTRIDANVNRP